MIFMRYMHRQRGGRVDFTQEELNSTLANQAPGSPNLSILSFKGCFHGRTIGLLSCSHSRPIQGVDIPTLPWPKADFPKYKYPLGDHARENKAEDDRCLALVEELMEKAVRKISYFFTDKFKIDFFRLKTVNLWRASSLSPSSLRAVTITAAPTFSKD